jgi:hypothetical protein
LLQPSRHQAIAKAVETFLIFALQLPSNSYLYLNISVDNGSKTAEETAKTLEGNWHFGSVISILITRRKQDGIHGVLRKIFLE